MSKTITQAIRQKLTRIRLRRQGVVVYGPSVISKTKFDGTAVVEPCCRIIGDPFVSIGQDFYMNVGCHLLGEITIGKHVQIGPKVVVWGRDHCMDIGTPIKHQPHSRSPINIGDDVWISANVTVLKGTNIGDGAVIGAGAVVTRNVPSMGVAVGNPARVIRFRGE